jgi:hypothetical protein
MSPRRVAFGGGASSSESSPLSARFLGSGVHDALTKPKSGSVNTPRAQEVGTARVACDELDDDEAKKLADLIVHPLVEL